MDEEEETEVNIEAFGQSWSSKMEVIDLTDETVKQESQIPSINVNMFPYSVYMHFCVDLGSHEQKLF